MIRLRLRRRDLVCQQAVELVTDYLEGTLPRADRRRYEGHLAGCPHCTEYLAQMRKTIELTGTLTPDDLTPQMQDEFIALYRARGTRCPRARPPAQRPRDKGHDLISTESALLAALRAPSSPGVRR
jgi:anti-sigma factor RsiW